MSSWRKIAVGTWRTAGDPSVYAILELEVSKALEYIEKIRVKTGVKVTLSHFIGKAIAETYKKHPHLNCILRFKKLYPRETIDIFFQVATDEHGHDLSGVTVRDADKKSIVEIAQAMQADVVKVREKGDPTFRQTKKTFSLLPSFLIGMVLNLTGFIMYALNIWSPLLGAPRDAFGSIMITNIGTLGLNVAFAPLVPYSHVPALIALGSVVEKPVVKNGALAVGRVVPMGITIDHRVIDGIHGSFMAKTVAKFFEDPEGMLGPV